jgi:tetratricopeptide (TPR) repeat protein
VIAVAALIALPFWAGGAGGPLGQETPDAEIQLLRSFIAELGRLRAGEDDALEPLQQIADRLCTDHDRCDAADVMAFYAGLAPTARRTGLEDEQRYRALRRRVVEAGQRGLAGEAWAAERDALLDELRALTLDAQFRPDFVPAAQALALCAQIELQFLEERPDLAPRELTELTDQVARDAQAANTLFRTAGQVTPRLEPLWILGRVERRRGRPRVAREVFESCYEQATRVRNDRFRERALLGLLTLALDDGDVPEQERQLRRLASFRAPGESWAVARGWGQLLLSADHPERALEFLRQHEPREGRHPGDRIEWHLLMGGAWLRVGMNAKARLHFESLIAGPSSDLASLALARLAINEGRGAGALELLRQGGLRQRLGTADRAGWHALAGEAWLLEGDAESALAELEHALEIADSWSERLELHGSSETTARSIMGEWSGLHTVALLADAHARLGRPLKALAVIEDAQSRTLRRREVELGRLRASAAQGEPRPIVSTGDVLAWSRHAELGLVTWVVGADFSVVAWAGPDADGRTRAVARRIDLGRRALEDAVRRLREAALAADEEGVERIAAEVRTALVPDDLARRLREARPRVGAEPRLLVLVHGPIERLPLELLDFDGEAPAGPVVPVALPGLPAALPGEPVDLRGMPWTLLGAPEGPDGPLLPGATEELRALAELHPDAAVAAGAAFDADAVLAALRRPGPLHIASHLVAECAHEGQRLAPAGLLLDAGETLCTHEVAEVRPRTPLVVLAACASGEGRFVDAQGLHGMARAFLEAGTRSVLVTLWPVDDRAAKEFSLAFHRALEAGASPARAAAAARRTLAEAGWGPGDQAAFRLLGRD